MYDSDTPHFPSEQPPLPPKRHRLRKVAIWAGSILVALIAIIWIAGALSAPQTPAHPAAGSSAAPAATSPPASSQAPSSPQSDSPPSDSPLPPPPGPVSIGTFKGTGNWNSPPFTLDGHPLTVTYSYSGNIMAGESEGDNFQADVESPGDDHGIVNAIAASGGATTTLYPDVTLGGTSYHLSVIATGSWTFTLTEAS
jgi:hypothetical protein